jgi:hypothetical protein
MPFLELEVDERTLRNMKHLERQMGERRQALDSIGTVSTETLSNLLHYIEQNKHKGQIMLTVFDERRHRYSSQTDLKGEIIPRSVFEQ